MKLYFFRGRDLNFGDELNTYLMPKVFGNLLDDEDDGNLMLAIGSILFDSHPNDVNKIVFGSGYGGYAPAPVFDHRWKVYCVRGPRTASVCGLEADKVAGDAAILINSYRDKTTAKTIRRSFMPHWQSVRRGRWRFACQMAGVHYLDPRRPVEDLLQEIAASDVVMTEAMHGAIVADALRVPWIAVQPFHDVHRFKWFDWADTLDLHLDPVVLSPSSLREARVAGGGPVQEQPIDVKEAESLKLKTVDLPYTLQAAASLYRAARREPQLSSDVAMDRVVDKLQINADLIMQDYRKSL